MPPDVNKPLRLGIWCDYGGTLKPTEGIGVFVYNLLRALLRLDEALEITLLVHPGDTDFYAEMERAAAGRLRILPRTELGTVCMLPRPQPVTDEGKRPGWAANTWHLARRRFFECVTRLRSHALALQTYVHEAGLAFCLRRRLSPVLAVVACLFAALPVGMLLWAGYGVRRFITSVTAGLLFPFDALSRAARHLAELRRSLVPEHLLAAPGSLDEDYNPMREAKAAGCDVWLVPYVGFAYRFEFPAVVVIHDLVHLHCAEAVTPAAREHLLRDVPRRAEEAMLCACMSAFIRDVDLLGKLGLPPDKVRMVRPAAPTDFPDVSVEEATRLLPTGLDRPFLLYPAAFRPYKNHRALVEALRLLRDRHGDETFNVVFTGIRRMPAELAGRIDECGLRGRVHVLGCVDRATLAALYQHAFATVVPTFYEQGSFPVYEAIHWGCPVACSEIPALVEQNMPLGDAMLYFDPYNPETLVEAILKISNDREGISRRQQEAGKALWRRTWDDVAREWLAVFHEAARRGASMSSRSSPPFSADTPQAGREKRTCVIPVSTPELETIKASIIEQAERQRVEKGLPAHAVVPEPAEVRPILKDLALARRHLTVGLALPELQRFPRWLRWLGRLLARGVLAASGFVTARQRQFNLGALLSLEKLDRAVQELEGKATGLALRCQQLERENAAWRMRHGESKEQVRRDAA